MILRNIRRIIDNQSKLLIIEMLIPSINEPSLAKFMDLEMLVMGGGGMERTEDEFRLLLGNCGLKITEKIPCGEYFILECAL